MNQTEKLALQTGLGLLQQALPMFAGVVSVAHGGFLVAMLEALIPVIENAIAAPTALPPSHTMTD